MAKFAVPVGIEFFEKLRRNGCYYVDKTELIYELAASKNVDVVLFTRPRRFGKTLTMSMLQSFFDITRDSKDVFEGLAIAKHEEFCNMCMNQYPVLFISFKDAEGLNFEKAYDKLKGSVADLCKGHSYLLKSENVDEDDREIFAKLKSKKADDEEVQKSLLVLTRMMYAHYGKPVILLIDEYDVPLAKAHSAGRRDDYPRMLDVIRGMMGSVLKTNQFLQFAVITGCLRISKESIFTGVNNFKAYGILEGKYSSAFGFTEAEVRKLLEAAGLSGKLDVVKSWYDGYIFGNSEIFCPWDVLNYVDDACDDPEMEPGNYWKNTSGNSIVDEFVGNTDFDVSAKFEKLMNGGSIKQMVTDQLTYGELIEHEDHLWSVLFMTGYLTKTGQTEKGKNVHLRTPNAEIESIFEDSVVSHFKRSMDRNVQKEILDAFWDGDDEKVSKLLSDLLWDTISYHDYHENYYHAFVTGMLVGCGYGVESNQGNGLGRTDIVVTDRKNRRAIIIEAKKAGREEELEKMCLEGKQQIVEKKYIKGLRGYAKIICYGISFFEKTALAKVIDLSLQ